MNSEKAFWFCIGGIISILLSENLKYSNHLENKNSYQQGVIDSQNQWLEYEKGGNNKWRY